MYPNKIVQLILLLLLSGHFIVAKGYQLDTPPFNNKVYEASVNEGEVATTNKGEREDCCPGEPYSAGPHPQVLQNGLGSKHEGEGSEVDDKVIWNENVMDNSRSLRNKRYPQHLDPNVLMSFWLRPGDCPLSSDGVRQNFCPSPTANGQWICIDDYQLCDGIKNCPNAEDESRQYCLFYNVLKSTVDLLTESIRELSSSISASDIKKHRIGNGRSRSLVDFY